jgi:hypothetical protein
MDNNIIIRQEFSFIEDDDIALHENEENDREQYNIYIELDKLIRTECDRVQQLSMIVHTADNGDNDDNNDNNNDNDNNNSEVDAITSLYIRDTNIAIIKKKNISLLTSILESNCPFAVPCVSEKQHNSIEHVDYPLQNNQDIIFIDSNDDSSNKIRRFCKKETIQIIALLVLSFDPRLMNNTMNRNIVYSNVPYFNKWHIINKMDVTVIDIIQKKRYPMFDKSYIYQYPKLSIHSEIVTFPDFIQKIIPTNYQLLQTIHHIPCTPQFSIYSLTQSLLHDTFSIDVGNLTYKQEFHFMRNTSTQLQNRYKSFLHRKKTNNNNISKQILTNVFHRLVQSSLLLIEKVYDSLSQSSAFQCLSTITNIDQGIFFYYLVYSKNMHLIVNSLFVQEIITNKDKSGLFVNNLVKKYSSIHELHQDDNKDIYVDPMYDDTPYSMYAQVDQYDSNQKKNQLLYLLKKEELYNNHNHMEMALDIIYGRKKVRENSYAIIEIGKEKTFYIRYHNKWIIDNSINEISFLSNSTIYQSMILHKQKKMKKKVMEQTTDDIITVQTAPPPSIITWNAEEKNKYREEFQTRLTDLDNKLRQDIALHIQKLYITSQKQKYLTYLEEYKQCTIIYSFCQRYIVQEKEKVQSDLIFQHILSEKDFPTKQRLIIHFANKYTRRGIHNEDPFWMFCKKTNRKIMPRFLLHLALSFEIKKNNYYTLLERLCRTSGKYDPYTNTFYEKYSGYQLLDKSMYILRMSRTQEKKTLASSSLASSSHTILIERILALLYLYFYDIPKEKKETILLSSVQIIQNKMDSNETYTNKVETILKKQNKIHIQSYNDYYNSSVFFIVSNLFFLENKYMDNNNVMNYITFLFTIKSFYKNSMWYNYQYYTLQLFIEKYCLFQQSVLDNTIHRKRMPRQSEEGKSMEGEEYNNPSNEFFSECQTVIRTANKDQRAYIGVLQNKIVLFCLFVSSFYQQQPVIQYISYPKSFIIHQHQTSLGYYIDSSKNTTCFTCEAILRIIRDLDAPTFISFEQIEMKQSNNNSYNPTLHFQENIIQSFIHHLVEKCPNYDNIIDYDVHLSRTEKYEIIEKNKKYNIIEFEKLLKSIFLEKMIPYKSYTFQSIPIKTKNDIIIRYHSQYIHVFQIKKEESQLQALEEVVTTVETDTETDIERKTRNSHSQILSMFIHMFIVDVDPKTLTSVYASIQTMTTSILSYLKPFYIGTDLFTTFITWKTKNIDTLYVFYKQSISILVEETTSMHYFKKRKDIRQSFEFLSLLKDQLHRRLDVFSTLYLYIYLSLIHTYLTVVEIEKSNVAQYIYNHIKKAINTKKIIDIRGRMN